MREALNRLSAEGLVRQEDQKGFRVAPVSMEELQELTLTRCWVHQVALRDAIEHGDAAWEERIVVAAHRLSRSPVHLARDGGIQNPEWDVLHREFHCAIISAARSRWIRDFYALLFDAAFRYQRLSVCGVPPRNVEAEHQAIVAAVLERRIDDAIALSDQHVSRTAAIVEQTACLRPAPRRPIPAKRFQPDCNRQPI